MTLHEFIFSNATTHKITRHAVFWLVYGIFFYTQSFVPSDFAGFTSSETYIAALKSVIHFLPACVLSVYVSIYFIYPVFIQRKKIVQSIIAILTLFAVDIFINYFTSYNFNQTTASTVPNSVRFNIVLGLGYLNAIWALIIIGIAIGIKVAKKWAIQQENLSKIRQRKIRTETDLQKGMVLPDFLLASLNNIQLSVDNDRSRSAGMILMLSNILSHILYKSTEDLIEVKQELFIVQQYISLENYATPDRIHLEIDAKSDFTSRYMPPQSLLAMIQQCSVFKSDEVAPQISMRISSRPGHIRTRIYCSFSTTTHSKAASNRLHQHIQQWLTHVYAHRGEEVRLKNIADGILILMYIKDFNNSTKQTPPVNYITGMEIVDYA